MATKKQSAAKSAVKVNPKKQAAPAKSAAKAAPAAKKAAPVKPAVIAKKVTKPELKAAPAKKSAPAKKTEPMKKTAAPDKSQKETSKVKAAPAPVPAKKAAPAKPAPVKKAAPEVKAAPAKKAAPAPAPKAAPAPVAKKAAPAPAPKPAPVEKPVVEKAPKKSAVPVRKVLSANSLDKRVLAAKAASAVVTKPMATPAARPTEKKPTVIIAHRRLENKSKEKVEPESPVTYQTEVYRSLLDDAPPPPVTVYRYSDEELVEFRELISNRLEAARKELLYLQGVITRKDEAGTEDTENRYMNMEDGSGAMEREQLAQLASRQIQFVNHLEKALIRIENKTYGICRVTGKLIEKARLRAVPHATLSIEAKKMMNTKTN